MNPMLRITPLIALALITLYVMGVLGAVPLSNMLSVIFLQLEPLPDRALWANFFFSVFTELDHIVVAFWMYSAVSRFDEDGLTWATIALVTGIFAVPLFLIHIVYHRKYGVRLHKSLTTLVIFLAFAYVLQYTEYLVRSLLPNIWDEINLDSYKGIEVRWGARVIVAFIIHIVFAQYLWQIIKDKTKATAWVIATLLLGEFPLMLKLSFMTYQRKRVAIREGVL